MARIPRAEIPKIAVIEDNTIISFVVESFESVETQGGVDSKLPAGCLMFKAGLRVTEPAQDADLMVYDNFVVGNEEDPKAEDPETWKSKKAFGARRLMEFLDAIGVVSDDSDDWENEAPEQVGQAMVIIDTPDKGKYKGQPQNRIVKYYTIGQAPTKASGKATAPVAASAKATARATPPVRAAAGAANGKPTTSAPAAATAPKKAGTTAAPAKAGGKPIVGKSQGTLPCAICGEMVDRSEFAAHVQACAEAAAAVATGPGDE